MWVMMCSCAVCAVDCACVLIWWIDEFFVENSIASALLFENISNNTDLSLNEKRNQNENECDVLPWSINSQWRAKY